MNHRMKCQRCGSPWVYGLTDAANDFRRWCLVMGITKGERLAIARAVKHDTWISYGADGPWDIQPGSYPDDVEQGIPAAEREPDRILSGDGKEFGIGMFHDECAPMGHRVSFEELRERDIVWRLGRQIWATGGMVAVAWRVALILWGSEMATFPLGTWEDPE